MVVQVDIPEPLASRIAAEAAKRGVSVNDVALQALEDVYGSAAGASGDADDDALADFIGSFDSGDPNWAATDTRELRAQASARRPA